jgi:hypothetical protein
MERLAKFIKNGVVTIPSGVVVEVNAISQPENVELVQSNKVGQPRSADKSREDAPGLQIEAVSGH